MDKVQKLDEYLTKNVDSFLFLDFDGVFNPFYTGGTFKKEFYNPDNSAHHPNESYDPAVKYDRYSNGREPKNYYLTWNSELISEINDLANNPNVQVVWLTTWREQMEKVVERLGFTYFHNPVYMPWVNSEDGHFGKVPAFFNFFKDFPKKDLPKVVWVDDVIFDMSSVVKDVDELFGNKAMIVMPDSKYGLSRVEVSYVKEFLKGFNNE